MFKNVATPGLVGAALGAGSSIGVLGMALGPIWGGSLFAYSSDPDTALGVLGRGRLFFVVLSALALANSRLASSLPAWPEGGQPWRFSLPKRTRIKRLPSCTGSGIY